MNREPAPAPSRFRPIARLAAVLLVGWSAGPGARAADGVDFGREVRPILAENCFACHGPDAEAREAGLRLDTRAGALRAEAAVIVPGDPDASEVIYRVGTAEPDEVMPPPATGKRLTPEEVATLRRWVESGAPWAGHWAFEPPSPAGPPAVRREDWPRGPIDRFVLARLEREGLEPAPEADRPTLIRRASLALTGLPPTPEEVDAFLADESPDAYETVVDRLLASPAHAERLAADWLDAARYADTNGFQNDFARTMWPWRDAVIDAFRRNQPFDQFLVEQVAGDLLPDATLAQKVASGFNRNNRTVTEAGSIDEEWRIENAVDRVETTATAFLGLTLGCARCHDHKFDPVTQREFYAFLGFFNSLNEKGVYTETRGNVPPLVAVPSPEQQSRQAELAAALAAAESDLKAREAGLPEARRRWEATLRDGPEPADPSGWSFRAGLGGSARVEFPDAPAGEGVFRGPGLARWADGPLGGSLRFDGKDGAHLEAWPQAAPERDTPFSYGGWVRWRADGAVLSKMDDARAFRGLDLLVQGGKVAVHLVHAWPDDAVKIITEQAIPRDAWSHVLVTHDGTGKAAGLAVYLDGEPAKLKVEADTLRGTIATPEPLRLGRRSASLALDGDLADVRLYPRALSAEEARALADRPALVAARVPEAGRSPDRQELLARTYRERFAPEFREARDRLRTAREAKEAFDKEIPTVMVMEDLPTPRPTYVLKRGRYDMPDETQKVEPGVPACLPPLPADAPRDRLGLARWLTDPDHPLTARVIVNRAWQMHFGTGLVKTAENLGLQGEPPSHPELLDWLAAEFVRSGWDLRALHRSIVTSATFRQDSTVSPEGLAREPENRLLARGPRFRLPAEAVRDNALAIAGLLDRRVGGPSVKPYQPEGLWAELAGGAGEGPYVQSTGPDLYRRSLYIYRKRTVPHPALSTFDAPSREVCQVRPARTNTPLQALALLNDPTYAEAARVLAQRMLAEAGPADADRVEFAFRRATARRPDDRERAILVRGLERRRELFAADPEAAARFVAVGDSPVPQGLDPVELAAHAATAAVILNLDETVNLD